jgi:hypothetical protein
LFGLGCLQHRLPATAAAAPAHLPPLRYRRHAAPAPLHRRAPAALKLCRANAYCVFVRRFKLLILK